MARKPPITALTPSPDAVLRAREYLYAHYPKQRRAIAHLSAEDALRCQASREKAMALRAQLAGPVGYTLARQPGERRTAHARRTGGVGGRIGGRILTPASLAARRACGKLGARARRAQAKAARMAARRGLSAT